MGGFQPRRLAIGVRVVTGQAGEAVAVFLEVSARLEFRLDGLGRVLVALDASLDLLLGVLLVGIGDVGLGMAILARHFAVIGMLEALLFDQQLGEERHVHALARRSGKALPAMAGQAVGVPFDDLLRKFRIDFGQTEIVRSSAHASAGNIVIPPTITRT